MRLAVTQSGAGDRTALLVHGIMSGARAWHRVAAELEQRGFRVIAVDLAGHGASPRAPRYAPAAWADDVVETVQPLLTGAPDLVLGHSLGALVASIAVERLGAGRIVYVDPAFGWPRGPLGLGYQLVFGAMPRPRRPVLRALNPKWSDEDLDIEVATLREWDRRTLWGFADTRPLTPPSTLIAPSLVIRAERSFLVSARVERRLRELGMTIETLPGTGHTVFRDDHAGFVRVLDRWLQRTMSG